jgi:hypothetical protein
MRKQNVGSRLKPWIRNQLSYYAHQGWGATQIERELRKRFGNEGPSQRTVEEYLKQLRPPDPTAPWSLGECLEEYWETSEETMVTSVTVSESPHDQEPGGKNNGASPGPIRISQKKTLGPEDARLVASAHAEMVLDNEGYVPILRRGHAERIAWLLRFDPDMPTDLAWTVGLDYWRRHLAGEGTADLDAFLGWAPWRGDEEKQRYLYAVRRRLIPAVDVHSGAGARVLLKSSRDGDRLIFEIEDLDIEDEQTAEGDLSHGNTEGNNT